MYSKCADVLPFKKKKSSTGTKTKRTISDILKPLNYKYFQTTETEIGTYIILFYEKVTYV